MGRRRYQKPAVFKSASKRNPRWEFSARVDVIARDGQIKRVERTFPLGECAFLGKREAEKLRDQILSEVVNKPAVVLQSQIQFGRVLDEFLSIVIAEVRTHTASSYASIINCHIRPAFGALRMCDLTPQLCQQWLNDLRGDLARGSRKRALVIFRNVWARANEWGYTREICPLRGGRKARLGPIEAGRAKTLPTVDQFRAILQLLAEPCRSMLMVATFTGMRISEIRGIQSGDVAGGILTIRRSMSQKNEVCQVKNAASWRRVPVGHLSNVFNAETGGAALLFDISYQASLNRLRKAARAVGIEYEGFGWHTFRRASVTWGKRAGASQADSMAQHGHSDTTTNDLYYVEDDADLARIAKQDAALFEAVMFGGGKVGRG